MKISSLNSAIDKLRGCENEVELKFHFRNLLIPYGIWNFKYCFTMVPDQERVLKEARYIGSFDPEFEKIYLDNNFAIHDVFVQHFIHREGPKFWAEVNKPEELDKLSKPQRLIQETSLKFGLVNGVLIPFRDKYPMSRGGIALQGPSDQDTDIFIDSIKDKLDELLILVEVFHLMVDKSALFGIADALSARELEVLKWISCGYRSKEIAHRLGTSRRTVEKQLDSAKSKTQCATIPQLVGKLFILGLMCAPTTKLT